MQGKQGIQRQDNQNNQNNQNGSEQAHLVADCRSEADCRLDLRQQIQQAIDSGRSQAAIARSAGISGSALSQYMTGDYKGNVSNVEAKLMASFEIEEERSGQQAHLGDEDLFVETSISTRIMTALRYAHVNKEICVIYGEAGLGKTVTCQKYASEHNAIYIKCPGSGNTAKVILSVIADRVGARNQRTALQLEQAIIEKLLGSGRMVIFDEANRLSYQALDAIRNIQEETNIGVALVGNGTVFSRMYGSGQAEFAQLFNRIAMPIELSSPGDGDAQAVCQAIIGKRSEQIENWAARKGATLMALRGVVKVLRLARTMAAGNDQPLTLSHVHRADRMIGMMVVE